MLSLESEGSNASAETISPELATCMGSMKDLVFRFAADGNADFCPFEVVASNIGRETTIIPVENKNFA